MSVSEGNSPGEVGDEGVRESSPPDTSEGYPDIWGPGVETGCPGSSSLGGVGEGQGPGWCKTRYRAPGDTRGTTFRRTIGSRTVARSSRRPVRGPGPGTDG